MKVIFVSGKYQAKTEWELEQNIRHAEEVAITLWLQGWAVLYPHLNTSHYDGLCPENVWLEGDLEILRRCDAIYMLSNWPDSSGARRELEVALELGLEVLYE